MDLDRMKLAAMAAIAIIGGWFASLPLLVVALLALQVADIISGLLAAWVRREINSTVARTGFGNKAMTWLVVVLGEVLSLVLSESMGAPRLPFAGGALVFYCGVEGLSILENAGRAGLPLPPFLRDALMKLRAQFDRAPAVVQPAPGQPVVVTPAKLPTPPEHHLVDEPEPGGVKLP